MATNRRKTEHLEALARDPAIERGDSGFDRIRLSHRALPQLDYDAIDTGCSFLGKRLSFPLLISAMTGGDDELIRTLNRRLATAAEACGVALAVGSQRVMFEEPGARTSFQLRQWAPTTVLLGNLGAVQLNRGYGLEHCQEALQLLDGDGLYLHLNPLQEAVQPEGDRDFHNLAARIDHIARGLKRPLLIKEVGTGLSPADIGLLKNSPIAYFDLAGRGGTSWSRIEAARADDDFGLSFQDWGLSTVEALRLNVAAYPELRFIASGGIRSGIDMAKAIILGAELCGVARPLLLAARESTAAVIATIQRFQREYHTALFLLGCANNAALRRNNALIL